MSPAIRILHNVYPAVQPSRRQVHFRPWYFMGRRVCLEAECRMRIIDKELLTFIFKLIDVQIKKYSNLADFGVGPDAKLNAKLVLDEVNDLTVLARDYLDNLKKGAESALGVFRTLTFYINLEYVRARAGWLIDENIIHNTVYERVCDQKKKLEQIAILAGFQNEEEKPSTERQKQIQHDSYAIAHVILDTAFALIQNPDAEIRETIPSHAKAIVRKHAALGGRYQKADIREEIISRHEACNLFLAASPLEKSQFILTVDMAQASALSHRSELDVLLLRFDSEVPEKDKSKHFSWYQTAIPEKKSVASRGVTMHPGGYCSYSNLFKIAGVGVSLLAVGVGVYCASTPRNS